MNVARSEEEAELQASGKSIQELAAEEEAAAEFEIAELFDDIGSAASDDDELACSRRRSLPRRRRSKSLILAKLISDTERAAP